MQQTPKIDHMELLLQGEENNVEINHLMVQSIQNFVLFIFLTMPTPFTEVGTWVRNERIQLTFS